MTLFTLADTTKKLLRHALGNLWAALFLALFGFIYEHFSFGVYSDFMVYAFLIPLMLGVLPLLTIALSGRGIPPERSLRVWNIGTAFAAVGCALRGAIEIYGTTNRLLIIYPIAAFLCFSAAILMWLLPGKCCRTGDLQQF